jgi:AmmeMemoRadiSam system protein A
MTLPAWTLDAALGASLPRFARACIAEALGATPAARPGLPGVDRIAATFVSLHRGEALHGCIGSLTAWRPLLDDVKRNALAAAFEDPRAPSLDAAGLRALEVEVSVLSPPTPVDFDTQADLLSTLRPGVDGLILEWGGHRGTFLPQVWEQLPEPEDFLNHLKRKAGLRVDFWAPDVKIDRYTVQAFVDPAPGAP